MGYGRSDKNRRPMLAGGGQMQNKQSRTAVTTRLRRAVDRTATTGSPNAYFPSPRSLRLCGEIALRIARKKQHSPVRRRHWPASFLWSSPANAGLCSSAYRHLQYHRLGLSAFLPRRRSRQVGERSSNSPFCSAEGMRPLYQPSGGESIASMNRGASDWRGV